MYVYKKTLDDEVRYRLDKHLKLKLEVSENSFTIKPINDISYNFDIPQLVSFGDITFGNLERGLNI